MTRADKLHQALTTYVSVFCIGSSNKSDTPDVGIVGPYLIASAVSSIRNIIPWYMLIIPRYSMIHFTPISERVVPDIHGRWPTYINPYVR